MTEECSQGSVLKFLIEKGGCVRNKELTDHFKVFHSGRAEKDRTVVRETFNRIVDNIAYVKQENGDTMVCLKKKYMEMKTIKDGEGHGGDLDSSEIGSRGEAASHLRQENEDSGMDLSDIDLVEVPNALEGECCFGQNLHVQENLGHENGIKEEGISKHPGNEVSKNIDQVEKEGSTMGKSFTDVAQPCRSFAARRRTSRGSQRSLSSTSEEADSLNPEMGTPRGSRRSFVELMMSSSPQVRRNLMRKSSQGQIMQRQGSVKSEGDSASVEEECTSVTLDPLEHEWMMCASDGEWDSLQRLLVSEPGLVAKKDFVTGFTCLHWAAKQGKHELLALLVTFAQQNSVAFNINTRSSAGYTPLHLAAMHNHIEVMKLLVGAYDADIEVRDYSGKKPSQYLNPSLAENVLEIVGACGDLDTENTEGGAGEGRWRFSKVLQSNLNPIKLRNLPEESARESQAKPKSLYRKPSIGRIKLNRSRVRTQIVHSTSFRETEEPDGSLKSPAKSRPISNLFG
ncbi:ankyrin repeat domain-containing protein SOWAHC [Hoplias malabaricus]|uniref:ankyrin repeat domain-containing protein SOWAHC n=1 Tax=Hoplias malabaricus TaxID=27720 RepID=UPI003462849C